MVPAGISEYPPREQIMETLRLWPAVPGGQPRVVPKTCSLGGYSDIPAAFWAHC
jgi:cytochrome P450